MVKTKKFIKIIFIIYLLPVWLLLLFRYKFWSFDEEKNNEIWYGKKKPMKWQKFFLIIAGILFATLSWYILVKFKLNLSKFK